MQDKKALLFASDNVGEEYIARLEQGANRAVDKFRYSLHCENLFGSDKRFDQLTGEADFCGVVLTPPLSDDRIILGKLEAAKMPFVRIAPMLDLERGSRVYMDEYDAAQAIAKRLLDNGHRRIGFIKGPRSHLVSIRRSNGFTNALGGYGLRPDPDLIVDGDFSRESGRDQARILFDKNVTAIFASNDEMALGVLDAARKRGLDVPGDLSVVGFDGNSSATRSQPPLTTIKQPLGEMGEAAVRMLIEMLANPGKRSLSEQVSYSILEGRSVAALEGA